MKLHYLVEGPSEAALLNVWLRRALPGHSHCIYPHEGKGSIPSNLAASPDPLRRGLLDQLPAKLRAFGNAFNPDTDRVVVLVDADDDDCMCLKNSLVQVLESCNPKPHALIRIAVEETEAFYLGDERAIRSAFQKFKSSAYRGYSQDSICGTWEIFQKVVGWKYEAKVKWASTIAPHLGTTRLGNGSNRSPSFRAFYRAICSLAGEAWV